MIHKAYDDYVSTESPEVAGTQVPEYMGGQPSVYVPGEDWDAPDMGAPELPEEEQDWLGYSHD